MLILNQYILLDPILLFFISGATYALFKFRSFSASPFTLRWWTWLAATGVMLAGAISVKFVGLFVVLFVGANTVEQLWVVLGDTSKPVWEAVKHLAARALCLIALPVVLYIAIFYVHLKVLYKT
jgi:dolichyl-phosphate-mannose-protein mannosyltransferase